jgi:hypothetical protein
MTTNHGVVMTHTDTPQQAHIVRTNRAARKVRAMFAPGTRVMGREFADDSGKPVGVVQYHVAQSNAQGGILVVLWDNGTVGRHGPISLRVAGETR